MRRKEMEGNSVIAVIVGGVVAFFGWLLRRAWIQFQKEREMLYELYGFVFGVDEVDRRADDDSVEDKLERGDTRFEKQSDQLERLDENVCRIADALDEDVDLVEDD
jgi:hypothetical protein